jgi:hypothetical protein
MGNAGKVSDAAMFDRYEDSGREEVRDLARKHTHDAIKTLVKLMKGPKTPPGVKRACASDILSQGWGRPDSRADSGGVTAEKAGLVINILKLTTGAVESVTHKGEEMMEVIEAIDVAKLIADNTETPK